MANETQPGAAIAKPTSSGLKSAAAAGVGIGSAIGGALIACLVFLLLTKRRRSKGNHNNESYGMSAEGSFVANSKKSTRVTISLPEHSSAAIVETNLPQPVEDNTITGDLSKLKNKIDGHIQSFYNTTLTNDEAAVQALQQLLKDSPIQISNLAAQLSNPRSRPALLRLALAWTMISRIELECHGRASFLPTPVTGSVHTLPQTKMDERSPFTQYPNEHNMLMATTARVAFLSKWRQITAALCGNTFTQEIMTEYDTRLENIRNAVKEADQFLAPYANIGDEARLRNLEEIMKRAARFGFLLFSQPSSFRFDWMAASGGLVVFPALLQVTDDEGKILPSARVFSQKEVMSV
jgi:hypothetical protein